MSLFELKTVEDVVWRAEKTAPELEEDEGESSDLYDILHLKADTPRALHPTRIESTGQP